MAASDLPGDPTKHRAIAVLLLPLLLVVVVVVVIVVMYQF